MSSCSIRLIPDTKGKPYERQRLVGGIFDGRVLHVYTYTHTQVVRYHAIVSICIYPVKCFSMVV